MSRDAGAAARMLSAVNAAPPDADADAADEDERSPRAAPDGARRAPVRVEALDGGRAASLAVRAQPGARRSGVLGAWNGALKLGVGAPPEDGRANDGLVRLVAELFDLRPSAVSLVAGERSRNKTFRLEASPDRVRRRLDELLLE